MGPPLPAAVAPFDISDDLPTEAEILEAVGQMKRGKAPGPSGMRTDHLKEWLNYA